MLSTLKMGNSCARLVRPTLLLMLIAVGWAASESVSAQTPTAKRFPGLPSWGGGGEGDPRAGSHAHRQAILDSLPLDRLTPQAREQILEIAEKPTLFRQLPTQAIHCDQDMFLFLTRNPDVLVGLWDMMGITKVQCRRIGPYRIEASDGVGTVCEVDLVYGDAAQHIFVIDGAYDGHMLPTSIRGKGVIVLRSSYARDAEGETTITGTLDCFVQLESLGVDLIARTLSPIIGRSADNNFMQTAVFISQVSQSSSHNPSAMLDIADRLPQVEPPTRKAFADTIVTVARRGQASGRRTSPAHREAAPHAEAAREAAESGGVAQSRFQPESLQR